MRSLAIFLTASLAAAASLLRGAEPSTFSQPLEFQDLSSEISAGRLPASRAADSEDDSDTIWIRCVVEPCEPKAPGCFALFVHVYRTKKSSNVERTVLKGVVDIYLVEKASRRVQAMTAPLIAMVPRGCCQKRGYGQRLRPGNGSWEAVVVFHRAGSPPIAASAPLE